MTVTRRLSVRTAWLVCVLACNKAADAPPKLDQPLAAKPAAAAKAAPARPAQLQQVTLKALGMYCEESCPVKVRYALADDPNVYELGFDVSTESIFVSYDAQLGTPKAVTKPMLAAIKTKAGFDPWLAKDTWPADAHTKVQVVWR